MRLYRILFVFTALLINTGCSNEGKKDPEEKSRDRDNQVVITPIVGTVIVPENTKPSSPGNQVTENQTIQVDENNYIQLIQHNGNLLIPVEGTYDQETFRYKWLDANQRATNTNEAIKNMDIHLSKTMKELKNYKIEFTQLKKHPKYGYFTGYLKLNEYENLFQNQIKLDGNMLLAPVVSQKNIGEINVLDTKLTDDLSNKNREDLEGFSGLKPMGVVSFLEMMKSELHGEVPNGSNTIVGVTDTGITYNHPSFTDSENNPRIDHMKDFTREGKVYFDQSALFEIKILSNGNTDPQFQTLKLNAEIYKLVAKSGEIPVAKDFDKINNADLLVSNQLAEKLKAPGHAAMLGVVSEKLYNSRIDLNFNRKTDDSFFVLLLSENNGYKAYLSAPFQEETNTIDFRKSVAVGDFNKTKETMNLVSEKFGFDIRETELENANSEKFPVMSLGIVGFDTAGHGSHVSGIIAGKRYIQNSPPDSLARGVVPDARIMVNRVCAVVGGCYNWNSAIIDLAESGAEIINMSLGGLDKNNDEYGIGQELINRLTVMENVLFMTSAGNSGHGRNTVGTPSTAKLSISVGASATNKIIERQYQWPGTGKPSAGLSNDPDKDFMLNFSSRGPSASGGFSPNLVAPGTELSAYPLHSSGAPGLSVIWGTSMSSPAAAGAAALLLDAAKIYNKQNPAKKLPTDALTLRKILIESARPFDANITNKETGIETYGQYSWIDQGAGMINLPGAWLALKNERDSKVESSVYFWEGEQKIEVPMDYTIQVRNKNPNGLDYSGTVNVDENNPAAGKKYGQGLWFDFNSPISYYRVSIARQLPEYAATMENFGELHRMFATSQDVFKLKTTMYGSNVDWLKVGVLNQTECHKSSTSDVLNVIGPGGLSASRLGLCIDQGKLKTLNPGDHGALIRAYKMDAFGNMEKNATFVIPVYVSVPERTLIGNAGYSVDGTVQSFGTKRHYIDVPEGTKLLSIKLSVPEAFLDTNGNVTNCSGVRLSIHEASNIVSPSELSTKSIANSCSLTNGNIVGASSRFVSLTRENPNPGIWELNVMGYYTAPESNYKIEVDYAKFTSTVNAISGTISALTGKLTFKVIDSSLENTTIDPFVSSYAVNSLNYKQNLKIKTDENLLLTDTQGNSLHSFPSNISGVNIEIGGAANSDLDLFVYACDASGSDCSEVGKSTGATDEESVSFNPNIEKFYKFEVHGFRLENDEITFAANRTLTYKEIEKGQIIVNNTDSDTFEVEYSMSANSLFDHPDFISGAANLTGELDLRSKTNSLYRIPVEIKN